MLAWVPACARMTEKMGGRKCMPDSLYPGDPGSRSGKAEQVRRSLRARRDASQAQGLG